MTRAALTHSAPERALALAAALATVLAAGAALASCGSEPAPPPGPAFTPATADRLKALGPDCELRTHAGGETRQCRGRQSRMTIELDRGRRLRSIDISILAATMWEAWGVMEFVLPGVIGDVASDAVLRQLRGVPAVTEVGGLHIAAGSTGDRHTVRLRWGGPPEPVGSQGAAGSAKR